MSVGSNLQEMENVVTKGAAPAEPMHKLTGSTPGQTGGWEDLGGPTPDNYRPDDDSATLRSPGATLAQVQQSYEKLYQDLQLDHLGVQALREHDLY